MNYNEFAESIKAKYPEYADMDNRELAEKMVAKYPEYNDVTFDTPKSEPTRPKTFEKQGLRQQAKMSPSEWANYKLDERANYEQQHPILSGINKEFNPTYRADKLGWENMAETNKPYPDFVTTLKQDASALAPALNTATAIGTSGASGFKGLLGAGALQGGVSSAVNDIADNGLSLQTPLNTLGGATVGGAIGGVAGGLPWLGDKATNWLAPRLGASLGGVTVDTIKQAVQPFSRAVDMTADQAKALLLDTTSNVRNAYKNLVNKAGNKVQDAVHKLRESNYRVPTDSLLEDITKTFDQYQGDYINPARNTTGKLESNLEDIIIQGSDPIAVDESGAVVDTISPIDLEKAKQQIGSMVNWNDETAKNYKNPILEQIYGKFNKRLSDLDPNLAQANEEYANLVGFKNNEGLRSVLRSGDSIDSASQTLKNYKSTVTKGNTGRNIQDLENVLTANGSEPFLDTIDDINATMDLENSLKTGRNFLGATDLAKQVLLRPTLKGIRNFNNFKANLPLKHPTLDKTLQGVNNAKTGVMNALRPLLFRGATPFQGYVSNDTLPLIQLNYDGTEKEEF